MIYKILKLSLMIAVILISHHSLAQSDLPYIQSVNYHASSGETPGMTLLKGGGYAKFGFFMDEPSKYTFLVEAKTNVLGVVGMIKDNTENSTPNTIRINVKPSVFQIMAGKSYSVNTSYYDPWIQKAEKDGELVIELNEPSNCTVVIEEAQGRNLLPDPSFEKSVADNIHPGWMITNSSAGEVSLSRSVSHRGEASICLTKKDIPGTVSFSLSEPVNVVAGKSYLAAGYYHLENARYGSVFNFTITISSPGKKDIFIEPLYTSHSVIYPMPISNPQNGWNRTFMNVNVPEDYENAKMTMQVDVKGVPFSIYFDDMEFRVNPSPAPQYSNYLPGPSSKPLYSKEEVYRLMESRAPVKVELPEIGKTPLRINDEPVPLIAFSSIFSSEWPNESAHKEYLRHGVKIHFIPVTAFSDIQKICTWPGEGRYDFKPLEEMLSKMLGFDPEACIMLDVDPTPYPELGDRHPEARWVNAFGQYTVLEKENWRPATDRKPGEHWNLSYTADIVQEETSAYFNALGEFLKTNSLGKSVVGIHISGGTDGQWFRRGWLRGFGSFDHSAGAEKAFREWLKMHYNNDTGALKEAWGDPNITFESVKLCSEEELKPPKYFLQTQFSEDRRIIDNLLFNEEGNEGLCGTINLYCKTFKEAVGRKALTFTYYPKKHDALRALIEQPYLDGILGVMEYGFLRNLGQSGGNETSPASLKLHNKLFLTEMDYRTEYATSWGEDGNHHRRNVVIMRSPEELANQMRRDLGNSLCQGQGGWFYGLCGHIWGNDDYYLVMDEAVKAAQLGMNEPLYDDHGQMAVFRDEMSRSYLSGWAGNPTETGSPGSAWVNSLAYESHLMGTYWVRVPFNRSGLTWDDYLLTDLDNSKIPKYKVYAFLNSSTLTSEQIKYIQKHLQRDGNVLLFFNNSGFSIGDYEENIKRLTGMQVKYDATKIIRSGNGYSEVEGAPLTGLSNIYSASSTPLFHVDDPTAIPVATIAGTDRIGAAIKNNGNWTSVYLSLPGVISPEFIRGIAGLAAITPIGPQEDVTYAGNGFLVIHAMTGGEKTLQWEGKSDLFDISTGTTVAKGVNRITIHMDPFETRWFKRRPVY